MLSKKELQYMNNGKIYKLVSNVTGDIYYGSTIQKLSYRLSDHKAVYTRYLKGKGNYVTSFKILETGDYDIHLVENYRCLNKKQLEAIERVYIENYKCINKCIPTRTIKEWKDNNKKHIAEQSKKYRQKSKKYLEWRTPIFKCDCGGTYQRQHKTRHMRTKKHINYCN